MVMTRSLSKTVASIVVLMLVWSPLLPALAGGPSDGEGDDPTGSDHPTETGSFTSTEGDDVIPMYTIVDGPDEASSFGNSIANMEDVDGDGIDDILVGSGWDMILEREKYDDIWPYFSHASLLPGRSDHDYQSDQVKMVANQSDGWMYPTQRWLGDVNGDGYADMINTFNDYLDWGRNGMPYPGYGNVLEVRYGTEDGLPNAPDLYLDLMTDDIPENSWISFQFGGVGDVNGDGYNDLFVYRDAIYVYEDTPPPGTGGGRGDGDDPNDPTDPPEPKPDYNETYIPPDFQLFFGSEDGLPSTHSWNGTPFFRQEWVSVSGVNFADFNGDGNSDIILTSYTAPHIRVYHGSSDGMPLRPDVSISFNQEWSYGWRIHSPVNVDGDDYDDMVVDFGQPEGLTDYIHYIYTFPGSEDGIPDEPDTYYKVTSHQDAKVVMTDINGDGLDDVFLSKVEQKSQANKVSMIFQVHFNTGEGFTRDPSWRHRIESIDGIAYSGNSDSGDFDGDGFGDVAIGVPGNTIYRSDGTYEALPGHVIIVNGGGIMDLLRPLTLREGPILYAGYQSYNFRVNVNPTGLTVLPDLAKITLDPDGANVVLEAGLLPGGSYIAEGSDPDDLVDLTSDLTDIVQDIRNNTIWVHFRVMFNWNWPHEDLCNVLVQTRLGDATTPYNARDLFYVENDLDFLGDIFASGEFQGDLEEDDWVRAGEEVTVSGPVVVYEGTVDIYPPDGAFDVVVQDNDGRFSKITHVSGAEVSISLGVEDATDHDENLTLTLQNLPGLATVVSQPRFSLGVDADLPTFINIVPDPDDWHSSKDVLVSATADDSDTAGVSAVTLEFSYSTNGGVTFTDWSRTGLETTSDGPTVDGLVLLNIPDGEDNFIRWRAIDLVGNGPAVSANLRIRVDTINVTYTDAFPDPNEWQTALSVECGVTIRDMDGAGIEVASIQYRVSNQNLSGYGEWLDWDDGAMTDTQEISVSQFADMADIPFNYIQWRARDIAGNGYTTSPHFRVKVDTQPIYFWDFAPTDGPFGYSTLMTYINVSDGDFGSGIAMATIEFRKQSGDGEWTEWSTVGMAGSLPFDRFSHEVEFLDGDDNRIQFRGWDVAGNGPGSSDEFVLTVDTTGPEFGAIAPGPEEKQVGPEVTVTISLWDLIVGLDATSIKYRFATDGDLPEEWSSVPGLLGDDGIQGVQVSITFAPGVDNMVQFRASDVLGNMAESEVATFWVNRAPVAAIKNPVSTEVYMEKDLVTLNANGSSDADGDDLNYTWFMGGSDVPLGYGKAFTTTLVPGVYMITLVVRDDMDVEDTSFVEVTVEEYVPPTTNIAGSSWWLLLILLAVITVAVVVFYKRHQDRQFEEWEEI